MPLLHLWRAQKWPLYRKCYTFFLFFVYVISLFHIHFLSLSTHSHSFLIHILSISTHTHTLVFLSLISFDLYRRTRKNLNPNPDTVALQSNRLAMCQVNFQLVFGSNSNQLMGKGLKTDSCGHHSSITQRAQSDVLMVQDFFFIFVFP